MNNKKKTLILVLSLVLVCSMLFGLVACAEEPEAAHAVISFKTAENVEGQSFKVYTDDLKEGYTIADLFLSDTTTNYGFKADMTLSKDGYFVNNIKGDKIDDIVPDSEKNQWIGVYSTDKVDMMEGCEAYSVVINDVTYYLADGISKIKIKEGVTYLFLLK